MEITQGDIVHHWIDGRVAPSTGDRTQDVFNPATGEVSRKVALGSVQDVEAAVASARPRCRVGRSSADSPQPHPQQLPGAAQRAPR